MRRLHRQNTVIIKKFRFIIFEFYEFKFRAECSLLAPLPAKKLPHQLDKQYPAKKTIFGLLAILRILPSPEFQVYWVPLFHN